MNSENQMTGTDISRIALKPKGLNTTESSTEKYSVIIHPKKAEQAPLQNLSSQEESKQDPTSTMLQKEDPTSAPTPTTENQAQISELKELLLQTKESHEKIIALQEKLPQELMEKIRTDLREESAKAALAFDVYLKTILKQRMGDANLEVEKLKVTLEQSADKLHSQPKHRRFLTVLTVANTLILLGLTVLLVLSETGII